MGGIVLVDFVVLLMIFFGGGVIDLVLERFVVFWLGVIWGGGGVGFRVVLIIGLVVVCFVGIFLNGKRRVFFFLGVRVVIGNGVVVVESVGGDFGINDGVFV